MRRKTAPRVVRLHPLRTEILNFQGRLTAAAAGQLLGLERRQVFRLLKAYRVEGPTGLISKRRGRRSNRRKPEALRRAVLTIIRQWYWDFDDVADARADRPAAHLIGRVGG